MNDKRILWRGSAQIETRALTAATEADLALVNRYTVTGQASTDDVYLCSAMVCNDQIDHYSTRFTTRALDQVAALLPGCNLMRNHNEYGSEDLPIGRIYAAERLTLNGVEWTRGYFYWERGTEDGDAMARKIGLGIWREVSLSWWMRSFTNSVDGKPFDESPYYPGQELPGGVTVVGIMDDVVEVNETSIVARGGQKGTSIGAVRGEQQDGVRELVAGLRSRARDPYWLARYLKETKPEATTYLGRIGIK